MRTRSIVPLVFLLASTIEAPALASDDEPRYTLTEAAKENRTRLHYDGEVFSGPALDRLLTAARNSQFFLIGEEHGIAENPKLAAQLFTTLVADGYDKLVIEVSPPMGAVLDSSAALGIDGLRALFALPGGEPAFFGMREEAELLATVRAALPDADEVFWGVDYEVASDRPLLRALREMERPAGSDQPLDRLIAASDASWAQYYDTGSPQYIFSFNGDPQLVTAVTDAWPDTGETADWILDTLRTTLEINQMWTQGRGFDSNVRRAAFFRENFLRHWHAAKQGGRTPKAMVKLGGNHVVRGRNMTGTYDLGSLLPELAALEGSRSYSVLVLPGPDSMTAVLDPTSWTFNPQPAKDNYAHGIDALADAAYDDAFTLIDLEALRPVVRANTDRYGVKLVRIVHGFDGLLVMSGSTASAELEHD